MGSGQTQAENSEKLQGSIFVPEFQLKVPRTNCEQITLRLIYIYIYIYI